MEFQRERVFTALDADELRAGDKVIVGTTIAEIRDFIEEKVGSMKCYAEILKILPYNCEERFCIGENDAVGEICFPLAYLVERAENCLKCKKCEVISDKSMHCDWVGTGSITSARVEKCNHYEPKTGQKEMCLNCKHYNKVNDFRDCTLVNNPTGSCPHYEAEKHYRPFKDTDELVKVWCHKCPAHNHRERGLTMPLIWVRDPKRPKANYLLTGLMGNEVYWGSYIFNMQELFDNFEFLDGSPCGVEE